MVRFILALTALVVVVAGCAKTVTGSAVAGESSTPLTAKEALGEFGSIDYCSLLDATRIPTELGPMVRSPKPAYEFCVFRVWVSQIEIEIRVGYLDDADTIKDVDRTEDRSRTLPRGLTVQRGQEDDEACFRYLRFIDDLWLTVSVTADSGKGDWCRIVDTTIDGVIRQVSAKQVKHYVFPDKSVGRVDACDLVPASVISTKLGIKDGNVRRFPSRHACFWTGRGSDPFARLFFGGESTYDADKTRGDTLVDHRTYVTPYEVDDVSFCDVETEHVDSPELGRKELVVLEVELVGKDKDACGPARELAKEVWAKLPAKG